MSFSENNYFSRYFIWYKNLKKVGTQNSSILFKK